MSDYGEPWMIREDGGWKFANKISEGSVGKLRARVTACVNFLAGVPTEDLEAITKYGECADDFRNALRATGKVIREPREAMKPVALDLLSRVREKRADAP